MTTVSVPNITWLLIPKKNPNETVFTLFLQPPPENPAWCDSPLTFRRNLRQTNDPNLLINLPVLGIGTSFD